MASRLPSSKTVLFRFDILRPNDTGRRLHAAARASNPGGLAECPSEIVKFESPPCPASKFIERCGHFCGGHVKKVDVVIVPANGLFRTHRAQIAYLALAEHLPTITDQRPLVEA